MVTFIMLADNSARQPRVLTDCGFRSDFNSDGENDLRPVTPWAVDQA